MILHFFLRQTLFLFLTLGLIMSPALAQSSDSMDKASSDLVGEWHQGLTALGQATENLQKTNTLLSYENERFRASLADLKRQVGMLSDKATSLTAQKENLKKSIEDHQGQAISFLEKINCLSQQSSALEEKRKSLSLLVDQELKIGKDLRSSTAHLKQEIEALEKDFFLQQQKDRDALSRSAEEQAKVETWLQAQSEGLRQLGHDVKVINQHILACYLARERAEEDRRQAEERPEGFLDENNPKSLAGQSIAGASDLKELLRAKKQEVHLIRQDPVNAEISSLRVDVASLQDANRSLKESLSYLRASLKRLLRQKSNLERTLLKK